MTDAPRPVPRAYPLERKDDVQALWDAAALAALQGLCANPKHVKFDPETINRCAMHHADAFIAERAHRLKAPTDD